MLLLFGIAFSTPPLLHVQEWVTINYQKGNIFIRSTSSDNERFGFSSKAMYRRWLLCSNLVKLGAWINIIDTVMNGILSFWHVQQYQISNHSTYNNGVQKASIWQLRSHYFPSNWKFMLIIILWFRAKTNFDSLQNFKFKVTFHEYSYYCYYNHNSTYLWLPLIVTGILI